MTAEENIKLYEQDSNAEANIRDAITKAYQNLKPESELVHTYENSQFPSFYSGMSGYGVDSGLNNLDPLTLLQNAWGEQGRMATAAQVARDAFDVRKAGMEDLIGTGVKQWGMGYQGAQNAYDRWFARKQHEDQMALQREQMRRAAGYGSGNSFNPVPTGVDPRLVEEMWRLKVEAGNAAQTKWNAGAEAARNLSPKVTTSTSGLSGYSTKVAPKQVVPTKSSYFNTLVNRFFGN